MSVIRIPYDDVKDNNSHFYWQQNWRGKCILINHHLVPMNHVLALRWWTRLHTFRPNFRFDAEEDVWPDDMSHRVDGDLFTDEEWEMIDSDPATLYDTHTHFRDMVDKCKRRQREDARRDNRLRFRFLLCMAIWRTVYAVRMVGVKRWRQWQDDVVRRRNEAVLIIVRNAFGMH